MKYFKYILTALLATVSLAGCSSESTAAKSSATETTPMPTQKVEENDASKEKLLDIWSSYLHAKNQIYEVESWAFDYIDIYLKTMEWEDLKAARAACSAAKEQLYGMETNFSLDEELKNALESKGIETDYIDLQFQNVESDVNDGYTVVDSLEVYLESCAMYENGASLMKDCMQKLRRVNELLGMYERQTTNYLLVNAGISSHEAYWDNMEALYPYLCLGSIDYYEKQEDVEKYGELVIGELTGLNMATAQMDALDEECFNVMYEDTLKTAVLHAPQGIPMPGEIGVYGAAAYRILANDNSEIEFVPYGGDMKKTVYDTVVYFERLDTQDLQDYLDLLGNVTQMGDDSWRSEKNGYAVDIYDSDTDTILVFEEEDMTFFLHE